MVKALEELDSFFVRNVFLSTQDDLDKEQDAARYQTSQLYGTNCSTNVRGSSIETLAGLESKLWQLHNMKKTTGHSVDASYIHKSCKMDSTWRSTESGSAAE